MRVGACGTFWSFHLGSGEPCNTMRTGMEIQDLVDQFEELHARLGWPWSMGLECLRIYKFSNFCESFLVVMEGLPSELEWMDVLKCFWGSRHHQTGAR